MQKIKPCLWFDHQAEEAALFYTSVFSNSKIVDVMHYSDAGPGPKGSVLTVTFLLDGQAFIALNGGPHFTFSPAISLSVSCATQQEVDALWAKLSADPAAERCGWLRDRYGVSWQIVPTVLVDMLHDPDTERTSRVMRALMQMGRLDMARLQQVYDGAL